MRTLFSLFALMSLFLAEAQVPVPKMLSLRGYGGNGTDGVLSNISQTYDGTTEALFNPSVAKISVYPNPSTNLVTVQTGNSNPYRITVFDVLGRQLYDGIVNLKTQINVTEWPNGLYNMMLWDRDEVIGTQKLIVRKGN